jgi:hypothetical protein
MAGTRGRTEAAEEYLGATPAFSVDDIGVNPGDIEVVDRVLTSDKVETERFMSEKILVLVQDSSDPTDDEIVQTWVNGRVQRFKRGEPNLVRRCYVEALARAKRTTYRQTLDERQGTQEFNQMRPHHSLAYPFTVLEDSNPKGRAWLLSVLAHAQRA